MSKQFDLLLEQARCQLAARSGSRPATKRPGEAHTHHLIGIPLERRLTERHTIFLCKVDLCARNAFDHERLCRFDGRVAFATLLMPSSIACFFASSWLPHISNNIAIASSPVRKLMREYCSPDLVLHDGGAAADSGVPSQPLPRRPRTSRPLRRTRLRRRTRIHVVGGSLTRLGYGRAGARPAEQGAGWHWRCVCPRLSEGEVSEVGEGASGS